MKKKIIKKKFISLLVNPNTRLLLFIFSFLFSLNKINAQSFHESSVRYMLIDITLGNVLSYYSSATDANSKEAVRRWNNGVRVLQFDSFERKNISGLGWTIVFKNTDQRISGMDVWLSSESFHESSVRYMLIDITLGNVLSYYSSATDANSKEAVRRWNNGVRVLQFDSFERKNISGLGWTIVFKNTDQRISGMDVWLSSESFHESSVRYMLIDITLGNVLSYYSSATDANSKEAVRRWNNGVRVLQFDSFERKNINGLGWTIVFKNTNQRISGMVVWLNNETTDIKKFETVMPTTYALHQNFPNPFNPVTKIQFGLPNDGNVRLSIYNTIGQEIKVLINQQLSAGKYSVDFDASGLTNGIYFYRLQAGSFSQTKKLILLK
jgi:hypothetical protein